MSATVPDFVPARTADIPPAALAAALDELRAVSPDLVLSDADAAEFVDPFQPEGWEAFRAGAVVQPESVDEVQEVVRIAGRHGIPLWPQGTGRNNGYGGAGPRLSGGITVNFRRMNRVLHVDEDLGYALVEPGVSFSDLYDELRRRGSKLMVSAPDLSWGGQVSNSLDHGLTYLPMGKDFQVICGLEVVTADGSLLRTNMGAMTDNAAWNLYRRSFGPSLDQLFMQSNFGIVTKAGVWLMPEPEAIELVDVDVYREDDLAPLVEILRRLRLDGTIDGVPCILNTVIIASTLGPRSQWSDADPSRPLTDAEIDEIAGKLDLGRWYLRFALYGDTAVVDHNTRKVKEAFEAIPGARVRGTRTTAADAPWLPNPSHRLYAGVPNLDWKDMGGWYGGARGGHMSFAPVLPLPGEAVLKNHRWARAFFEERGYDYTADIIVVNARSACHVTGITYDIDDAAATARSYRTLQELVEGAGARHIGEYRAHLHYMDLAQAQYDFEDGAYLRFVERIKDAVDPHGILAPGKSGIWPASLRTPKGL